MRETKIEFDAQGVTFTDSDGDSVDVGTDNASRIFIGVRRGGDYEGAYLDRDAVVALRQLLDDWLEP